MATTPLTFSALEFVGRSTELSFLLDRVAEARAERGSTVLIAGDAGIGKSRLVGELKKKLDAERTQFGTGSCLEYMRVPYLPLLEAFRNLAGPHGDRRRAAGPLERWLEDVGSQAVSIPPAVDDQQKFRRFNAALKALNSLAVNDLAVLAVEDIQWADDATVEFLDYLTRNIHRHRLFVVATFRREAENTAAFAHSLDRLRRSGARALMLAPLTLGETRELTFRTLRAGGDFNPLLVDRIYELSEGNPLYIEELLRGFNEGSFGSEGGTIVVPLTVQAAVQERLKQFAAWEREILILAAVIGSVFSANMVARLSGKTVDEVSAVLHKARMSQLVVEDANEPGNFRFRHGLIRATLYEQRSPVERRQLHARIAKEFETGSNVLSRLGELAYHWSSAGVPDKAIKYNEQAGDAAMRLYAYSDAVRVYEHAIGLSLESGLARATIVEKLAYALSVAGFGEHARIWFERALDEYRAIGAADKMVSMLLNISAQCWVNAEAETAIHMCARALDVASFQPENSLQFNARVMLATYCALCGRAREALDHLEKAERIKCVRQPEYQSRFYDVRGISLDIVGDTENAQISFERALALATETKDRDLLTRVSSNFADFAISTGQLDRAKECWQLALAEATQTEFVWHTAFLALSFAWTQFLSANFVEARRLCEWGLARGEASTLVRILAAAVGIPLGLILEDETLVQRCTDEDAIEFAFRSGEAQHIGGVTAAFAQLYIERGQIEKARALLHRAVLALPNADQAEIMLLRIATHGDSRDIEPAHALLQSWSQAPQHLTAQAFLALFDACVASRLGKIGVASACAARAACLLQALDMQYYCGRALELVSNHSEALRIYEAIGARRDQRRLEAARDPQTAGRPSDVLLTLRELEIAKLAATGMTNRSIAEALTISKRTVDHHVNAILTRAGLRSRVQLPDYLRNHGITCRVRG